MRGRRSIPKDRDKVVKGKWSMMLIIALSCCVLSFEGLSQKISTLISKDKIVIGEQLFVKIKVEGLTEGQLQQDFQFPDTINHLEILADSIEQVNSSTLIHTLTITSFDSGYWQLPSFNLLLSDQRTLSTTPLHITVLPADISGLEDYHDIKDILEVNPENNWWIIASLILLALISFFGILWFMNSKKTEVEEKRISPTTLQQLYESTIKQIDRLSTTDIDSKESVVLVYSEATELTRSFIDKAQAEKTSHLTTGEYMLAKKNILSNAELESKYFQFLRLADAVKFARYSPPAEETTAIFPMLKNIITSVYEQNKTLS